MAINYPAGIDVFSVPSLPEETSLSSAGAGGNTRNHTQLHDDINKAVVALQTHAAQKTHDHSGIDNNIHGPKLAQANTHQSADTDSSPTAIHHTLGPGANQAAPGNHTHDQTAIPQNYQICTSTTRPAPWLGMLIFETDTNQLKIWAKPTTQTSPSWHILFGASAAVAPDTAVACRLRQGVKQKLGTGGTIIEWHEELEDTLNYFNPASSLTSIVIRRPGLYQVDCAIQWDPQLVPDEAHAVLCINGVETAVRSQAYMRGNLYTPNFSQTLSLSGKLRFTTDQVLTVKVSYTANNNIVEKVFSFVEAAVDTILGTGSRITSRIDVVYVGS
jgi:hypothetical protein